MKKLCGSCALITLVNNKLRCSIAPRSASPGYSSVSVGASCIHDTDNMTDRFEPAKEYLNESLLKKIQDLDNKLSEERDKYARLLDKLK